VTGSSESLVVRPLADQDAPLWDAFVEAAPDGTFFHLAGWRRVLAESFGHKTYFVLAESGGDIRGVLPLVHVKSRLFSNGLISNAFCVYGGPLAADAEALAALDRYALTLMQETGADFIEYRNRTPSHPDWACKDDLYVTFRKEIDPSPEVNLKAIPRKQRAVVRKALDQKRLREEIDGTTDRFFHLYAMSVRNHGTPVFPARFFRLLKEEFGDACEIVTVLDGDEPISCVMSFYFRDEVLPYYAGGTPAARSVGAHDYMYWRLIEKGGEQGIRVFDFGRSKVGTGSFSFKKNWGFTPEPLHYEFMMRDGKPIPEVNPLNPKYHLMIEAWKRLPLPVANAIGPLLARNLG